MSGYASLLSLAGKTLAHRVVLLHWLIVIVVLSLPGTAVAHFEHFLSRIVHVAEEDDGLRIYSRIPLALAVLPETWEGIDAGQKIDYVATEKVDGEWRYYVDRELIQADSAGLAGRVIEAYRINSGADRVTDYVFDDLRVYAFNQRPSFNSLKKARASFNGEAISKRKQANNVFGEVSESRSKAQPNESIEVFDAVVDISFFVPNASLQSKLNIASQLGDHLPIINQVVNIVLFHTNDADVVQTTAGVLDATINHKATNIDQLLSQGKSGIHHILIGMDHILFIILLILAATTWVDVLKKATAFTLGHSITLMIGVLGYTPSGAWFIPFIETAIAASIVYAGISVLLRRGENFSAYKIFLIGMLHGFGFSFVLNEVLLDQGAISLTNLLGFNLGIEAGQLLILSLVGPLIYLIDKYWMRQPIRLRQGLTVPCVLIAAFWVVERGIGTLTIVAA